MAAKGPGKFSPTKFGKGPMGGPTGGGRQGVPNRKAIANNLDNITRRKALK